MLSILKHYLAMAQMFDRDEEGQGLVEYGLILALISVVVVVVLGAIGTNLLGVFTVIEGELAP